MDIALLKKKYILFQKKYKLPDFKKLNEDFEIDKIERDSDCFLRVIRKAMMEKIVNSIGFLEMLLNPVNAPRIYFPYFKSITLEDKNEIELIYGKLGDLSLDSLSLEVGYSEKEEAKLIKKTFEVWNSVKSSFNKIVEHIKKPSNTVLRKEKSYFG